jgi:hypothetical protein
MRPDDLREWLFQVPFQPFRMYVLESTSFEIHHPELVFVQQSTIDLYTFLRHIPELLWPNVRLPSPYCKSPG